MRRPIVYYAIAIYIGCFSVIVFEFSYLMAMLVVLSFLTVVYIYEDIKSFSLVCSFFIVGCMSCFIYFNLDIGYNAEFRILEMKRGYCSASYKGRVVYLEGELEGIRQGERIEAVGKFQEIRDYSRGNVGRYYVENYTKKKEDLITKLYSFRHKLYIEYSEALDSQKGAVIMACCYGDTKYLSYEQKDNFNKLGISHIISVSGFHVAIVYKLLERIFGLRIALIISGIYMIFTGSKASTARAFIMILILKMSKLTYRNYDRISSLSLAALILLLVKPYYVLDIGFNLSFLATIGIILYNKTLQRRLYKLPKSINESLSITLSSQIFSMPYAMCTLKNISMFFIPGNLILVPLYSIVVILGNVGILIYKIKPLLKILTYFLYLILTILDGVIYTLMKIAPSVTEYNLFYGICMIVMFISFVFVKYGYSKVKYFPILLFCLILMYNMV